MAIMIVSFFLHIGGWLSGKVTREGAPEGTRVQHVTSTGKGPVQSHPSFPQLDNERTWATLDAAAGVADELGATMPQVRGYNDRSFVVECLLSQVALAWLLHKPNVPSVVIGAKNIPQLDDNLKASKLRLNEEQLARLDAASEITPLPYPYEQIHRLNKARLREDLV